MQIKLKEAYRAIEDNAAAFETYYNELIDCNKRINLTAITQRDEVFVKHFEDSLALLDVLKLDSGSSLIDIGSGAGFPGLALKAGGCMADITLLDSTRKRIDFLQHMCEALNVSCNCVWNRAETAAHDEEYRGRFDFAAARAVAKLSVLIEYAVPFLKEGGIFAALKGPSAKEEAEEASAAAEKLGSRIEDIAEYCISDGSKRAIVLVKKISQTPTIYPRPSARIAKNPL